MYDGYGFCSHWEHLGTISAPQQNIKAVFTLYRIGFCSVAKVAPIQCEQELMSCCGAQIVPKCSQCEHKSYPSYNLQRSLLISKDRLPKRGSLTISASIKVFRLDSDRFKNLSDTERSTFQQRSGAVLFRSRKCFESSVSGVNRIPIRYAFCDATFHYPVQCEHSLILVHTVPEQLLKRSKTYPVQCEHSLKVVGVHSMKN